MEGSSVHLQCAYSPANDSDLTVQWKLNGKPMQSSSRLKTVADFGYAMLDISKFEEKDQGEYSCHITNRSVGATILHS